MSAKQEEEPINYSGVWDTIDQYCSSASVEISTVVKTRDEEMDIQKEEHDRKLRLQNLLTILCIAMREHYPNGEIPKEW